jgi:hypothetical protein
MTEYLKSNENKKLIGKRAKIKNNLNNYCSFLWNKEGIIEDVYNNLYLKFTKRAYRSNKETDINGMDGVYLMENSFDLIEELKK